MEKVYGLAEILVIPSVQLELCMKFDEPSITPKIFMDYFNQVSLAPIPIRGRWQLDTRMRAMSSKLIVCT